ncbi:helix-turn-helix domain-containing protein [Adlercreutzia sp. ZJ242]|uniref:helix-turn-helix domain-containing protein n=1 Tax=Adlercreutzia sp. ZJ242 TaxID=2709409 RepID=UPI002105187F|nr:helix-turn-helix domain-containing protein [Adlercreutzia sp. ZJ242]
MNGEYKQLTLRERREIEEGLTRGDSFRAIARLIGRQPSTVSREVRENRHLRAFRRRRSACRDRNWCKRVGVCAECLREGAFCAGCDARDCRDHCAAYADRIACDALVRAPWVCNGCRKNRYGCNRANRYVYDAEVAQKASDERRSESRKGIDMDPGRAEAALARIKDGESRGLSPYEISVLYADVVGVSQSTIYRWTDAGYGGLTNLELERKVGFRPRRKKASRKPTRHSPKRSYDEFKKLPDSLKDARTELDCVVGRNVDKQAVLTLYNLPCHIQLGLLLKAHDCASVIKELRNVRSVMPKLMHTRWMRVVLTDNGEEFADENSIGELLGERAADGDLKVHLYYCDPRQSQQKGGCEKNTPRSARSWRRACSSSMSLPALTWWSL